MAALACRSGCVFVRGSLGDTLALHEIVGAVDVLLGYDADQLVADPGLFRNLVHPEDRRALEDAWRSAAQSTVRVRAQRRDGAIVWIEHVVEPEPRGGGGPRFRAALVDVTAQARACADEALFAPWLRLIADSTPMALFVVDERGCFARFYYKAREGGAQLRSDVVGLRVADALHDFPGLTLAIQRAAQGQSVHESQRIRGTTIEVHCAPIIAGDGRPAGALGVAIDLTRQVSLDESRRDSEAFFQSIIQTVNDGILVNDVDGVIEYANERLARFLGTTAAEMVGRRIFDYMDDESAAEARENLRRRRAGAEDEFDFRWRRRDGSEFWSIVHAKPLYDASGAHRGSVVAINDITRRKLAEDALRLAHDDLERRVIERTEELQVEVQERRKAEEQAIQANRTKSAFLASMSHELRTPLNAILGYSELVAEEMADAGDDEYLEELRRIHHAGAHLLELINDILDLSKIEAAKMELHMERFVLGELVRELDATTMPLALKNDNRLAYTCAACDHDRELLSDRTKVKQILLNLISNACKFTQRGEVRVDLRIEAIEAVEWLFIDVADSGIGIPAERLDAIFQAFTQADARVVSSYGGTGLGLTISRRLAQMLGGDIHVRSVVGVGSTFTLAIPLPRAA